MIIETFSSDNTKQVGFNLGKKAKKNDVFCLTGNLGVGKTVFSKGFAQGLLLEEDITSPTFTIVNEYKNGRLPFYHFDVYRLESSDDIFDLGFDEYIFGDGVCLVEWAEIIKEAIPQNAVWVTIEKNLSKGENYRLIKIDE